MRYEKAKQKAWEHYAQIEQIFSNILNDWVGFTRLGFHHIIRKRGIERPKSEQKRRFELLGLVGDILQDDQADVVHLRRNVNRKIKLRGKKVMVISEAHVWVIKSMIQGRSITMVVRQFKKGKKHFLTIYENKKPLQEKGFFVCPPSTL